MLENKQLLRICSSAKEATTRYDRMVDELIIQEIKKRYPDHSLLTEEDGLRWHYPILNPLQWCPSSVLQRQGYRST